MMAKPAVQIGVGWKQSLSLPSGRWLPSVASVLFPTDMLHKEKAVASKKKKKVLWFNDFYNSSSLICIYISNDMDHGSQWKKWGNSSHKNLYILCLHGCSRPRVIIHDEGIVIRTINKLFHKGLFVCWLRVPRSKTMLVGPVNNLQKDKQYELMK